MRVLAGVLVVVCVCVVLWVVSCAASLPIVDKKLGGMMAPDVHTSMLWLVLCVLGKTSGGESIGVKHN